MPIKPLTIYTQYHSSENFSLSIKRREKDTKLIMKMQGAIINTRELPQTYGILKKLLPSVLQSTCYNDDNIPFRKEVMQTEIGHLFEHILIEYLCLLKMDNGYENVEFSGVTKWNWIIYPKGTFHITISAGLGDTLYLAEAMTKSISLINLVMSSVNNQTIPVPAFNSEVLCQPQTAQMFN